MLWLVCFVASFHNCLFFYIATNEWLSPSFLGHSRGSQQDSEDDPYYMTLHKLWTKMLEGDWRTVTKSLYILHSILRDCEADACEQFHDAIK
jgi:hypothetical protein